MHYYKGSSGLQSETADVTTTTQNCQPHCDMCSCDNFEVLGIDKGIILNWIVHRLHSEDDNWNRICTLFEVL